MTLDGAIMIFAGAMILLTLGLAITLSLYWLLLTAFVGLNLIQSSFTGFCPMAIAFKKLGVKSGAAFS
jgi:hypothetical protein